MNGFILLESHIFLNMCEEGEHLSKWKDGWQASSYLLVFKKVAVLPFPHPIPKCWGRILIDSMNRLSLGPIPVTR